MQQHTTPKTTLLGIDILRFLAATLVTIYHWTYLRNYVAAHEISHFAWVGAVGVEIFFVISGLVIAYSAGSRTPFAFFKSRVVRLIPTAWVCASLTALVLWVGLGMPTFSVTVLWLKSAAFVPLSPWIDPVYWTLGIELTFYAVILLFLWQGWSRYFVTTISSVGLISTFMWCLGTFPQLTSPETQNAIKDLLFSRIGHLSLLTHGAFFALGVLIWNNTNNKLTRFQTLTFILCVVGGLLEIRADSMAHRRNITSAMAGWPMLIFALGLAWITLSTTYTHTINKVLQFLPTRTIGLATYPVYLLHNVVGSFILVGLIAWGFNSYWAIAITFICVLGIAIWVCKVAEHPIKTALSNTLTNISLKMGMK